MAIKYSEKAKVPSNKQADIVRRISGKSINTIDGFYEALQDSIFIAVINDSKTLSSAQRRKFFDDYATDAGLDISNYSSLEEIERNSKVAQLSAAKKTSIPDMQTKLDELCPPQTSDDDEDDEDDDKNGGTGSHISASGIGGGKTESEPKQEKEEKPVEFTDMAKYSWAKEAVTSLSGKKIINGYSDGTFKPEGSITRAEFTAMIARAFLPKYKGNSYNFNDVKIADWHYEFVMAAYENGIISGVGEGDFLPGNRIRRCDMAVILNNLLKYKGANFEGGVLSFGDTALIPEYATEAVSVLNGNKIINGDDDNNFRPNDFANRAEAAVMLHRFMLLTEGGSK